MNYLESQMFNANNSLVNSTLIPQKMLKRKWHKLQFKIFLNSKSVQISHTGYNAQAMVNGRQLFTTD